MVDEAAGLRTQYERTEAAGFGEKRGLAKSAGSGILNDTNSRGIPITDEAIQRVPLVRPSGWSQEQAERLQEAHRELLRAVRDKPVGTEAGAVYKEADMTLIAKRIGEDAEQGIRLPRCSEPYVVIHNHPSSEIFSVRDLDSFFYNEEMIGMTAVGNYGNVYVVLKSAQYDGFRFGKAYREVTEKLKEAENKRDVHGYISIIKKFLNGASDYGVEFIKSGS